MEDGTGQKLAKLSERARRFADIFIADPSHDPASAYAEAGYNVTRVCASAAAHRLLASPSVSEYIRSRSAFVEYSEFGRMLENRAMCMDLWRSIIRAKGELDGEEVSLKLKLEASRELAKTCIGVGAGHLRPQVNVNVSAPATAGIQVCDPYDVPVGSGEVVEIKPVPGGFGGDDGDAD